MLLSRGFALRAFLRIVIAILTLSILPGFVQKAGAGEVVSVFPTGSVKRVQQVVVKFSTDMVPMGDPRSHKDPLQVKCEGKDQSKKVELPKATARWVDNKTWSYDFATPLTAGIKCTLTMTTTKDLSGHPVTALASYQFSTGGPALLHVSPRYGDIEPDQFFVLHTDGPMDTKSVETLAYFESEKLQGKVPVRIITGVDREKVLRAAIGSDWSYSQFRPLLESKRAFSSIPEMQTFLVISAKNRFAESSKVVLHWPVGILSASQVPVEEPQKFEFAVIPPFEAKFTCERNNPASPCNPILGMRLEFSRMVDRKKLAKVRLIDAKGTAWTPVEFDPKAKKDSYRDASDIIQALTFAAPFPALTTFKIALPSDLKDELGRSLANQAKFPLEVKTDDFTPLIKFASDFGILEKNADPILPVSLRNVEKNLAAKRLSLFGKSVVITSKSSPSEIIRLYRSVLHKEGSYESRSSALLGDAKATPFKIDKPGSEKEFELVGIPLKEAGLHVVEMESPKLGAALLDGPKMYVSTAALVTNLAVHLKKGRESSAVWVTTLDHAKPVASADVSLVAVDGTVLATGKTDASGIWRTGEVKYPCAWDASQRYQSDEFGNSCEVYAFAKSGEDFSFVSNQWTRGIEEYRFNLSSEYLDANWGPVTAHAVLDRSLIQAGETLHFKTYLREYTEKGFRPFSTKHLPKRIQIVHRASNKTFSIPFAYDEKTGTAVGEFKVPKDATLGFYEIFLTQKEKGSSQASENESDQEYDWRARSIGNFLVAEYRLPMMEATVKIQGAHLIQPKEAKVDLSASYLSGGPAVDLKVKVRASINATSFHPDFVGSEEYTFFSRAMKVGSREEDEENRAETDTGFVFNKDTKLDAKGGTLAVVTGLPSIETVRSLVVEMEYRDPNGEVKTGRSEATLFPADAIIGLRADSWLAKAGKANVAGVIVNPAGKPVAGQAYVVEAFRREYLTHRKRLVGGFYSYDSSSKTVSLGKVCEGKSNQKGEFHCEATKLPSGSVTLQARTVDAHGHSTLASIGLSIYDEGDFSWWMPSDNDRIDLLPEKKSYGPEETAKFVLRSPFPTATVLVTVEREGVLDAFVREIKRDNPVIEVPLKGHYAPNVFVSALAIRGRVGDPSPTALIDLAKPAMKLGIAKIKVGWKAHELKVTVTPEKKRYRTRDKAVAVIKVTRADGGPLASAESELAIAVVDESLALLRKNWSLDLLSGMMRERALAVDTSSAQNQIIGKRHFGSKAKPPGGGGGAPSESRELFDPLLLWLPRVKLNDKGEAKITIPLNDSMTSFRINAVAHSGSNHFGLGSALIESSKDLILYSGFAPVVRDGDVIKNALTLRNTTDKAMKVELTVTSVQLQNLPKFAALDLKPSESKIVEVPVTVPAGLTQIEYVVVAKDKVAGFSDNLKIKTRVQYAVPDQVLQATLFQLDKPTSIPVQQPKDAIIGRGGLAVEASASLLTSLAGVKMYMSDYPYSCLEQKISRAVVLEDATQMKSVIQEMPAYLDARGLLKFFPVSYCGSEMLSRYVLSIVKANGYEIPIETQDRVLTGLTSSLNGSRCVSWWDTFSHDQYGDQERVLIMDVLSLYKRFSVEQLKTVTITPNLWTTTAVVALNRLLLREAQIPNREALLKQTENILRARVNYQGSLMNLQGAFDWEAAWRLFSSHDLEAMDVFGLAIDVPSWHSDIGKLARGITARQKKGIWDTTTANAWGVTALRRFAATFEKEKVAGKTTVQAAGSGGVFDWTKKPAGEKTLFKWPTGSETKPVPVAFSHQGAGKPWVLMQTRSAIPLKKSMEFGYSIVRKVTRVSQGAAQASGAAVAWKSGDVANVELTITAKNDQPWVVVRDPIPAGASHLGTGMDGESAIMDRAPKTRPKAGEIQNFPSEFEEKTQSHFVAYAGYLMRGSYKINYRIRLNSTGTLKMPPTHVEALYSPENFGEAPIATWSIAP